MIPTTTSPEIKAHGEQAAAPPLFRQEALESRRTTWLGDVLVSQPRAFKVMSLAIVALAIGLIAILAAGQYARKASATGYVSTSKGLVKVTSQAAGAIQTVLVKEGQRVKAGETLAIVNLETTTASGKLQSMSGDLISQRRRALSEQIEGGRRALTQERLALERKADSVRDEIERIDRQIDIQQTRLQITEAALGRFRKVQEQGFISELAVQEKEKDRLADLAAIEALGRARINLVRDLGTIAADIDALVTRRRQEQLRAEGDEAQIATEQLQSEARRQTLVVAPISGVVTGMTSASGMSTQPGQGLMTIIPEGASIQVDAYVLSRSVGFLKTGSSAKLQYQAFPYQKFGTHDGVVTQVSEGAVSQSELPFPATPGDVYYVVSIRPESTYLLVAGRKESLRPGMKVDVRLVMESRTVLEWIFDPIIALQART